MVRHWTERCVQWRHTLIGKLRCEAASGLIGYTACTTLALPLLQLAALSLIASRGKPTPTEFCRTKNALAALAISAKPTSLG